MESPRKAWIFGLSALAGCFGVIVLYYAAHKPLTPELVVTIANLFLVLVSTLALVTLAGVVGTFIFDQADIGPLANMALQAGMGLGLLGLGVLIVGSTLGLPRWLLWGCLPLLLIFRKRAGQWWKQIQFFKVLWLESGIFSRSTAALAAVMLSSTFIIALAPPIKFDSLVYHLVLPNAYLQVGHVSYLPWIVMSGMPQNAEMLYTWAIALGGNTAATLLSWMTGVLSLVGLLGYLQRRLDTPSAWAGAACLLAGFTTTMLTGGGYVDWLVLLEGLGALICLDLWRISGERRVLLLAGVFIGLAVGTKYTSVVLALTCSMALVWHVWSLRRKFIPAILGLALPAALTSLPWFLKNWISTGNPVYPFVIPAGAVTPLRISVYQNLPPWGTWLDFFFLPLRATYLGLDSADGYMASIGPLLVGLGAFAWIAWKKYPADDFQCKSRACLENAAVLGLAGWLVWGLGNRLSGNLIQTRYYFSVFPAFAVLGAAGFYGIRHLDLPNFRLGRVVSALIILVLGFNLLEIGLDMVKQGAIGAVFGLKTQETYLAENLGWFQPAMQTIRDLPPGERTLLLFEPRSLYCQPRCAPDEILDRWKRDWSAFSDGQAVRHAWLQEGFTHVLFYRKGAEFLVDANDPHHTKVDLDALNAFLETLPPPINFGDAYLLYSLK